MGKNKGKQKKNVFKVAGAKSLKLKAKDKARPVTTQLKKFNNKTKAKITESNKQLEQLEDTVRQTTKLVKKTEKTVNVKKNLEDLQKETDNLEAMTDKTVEDIEAIKMT